MSLVPNSRPSLARQIELDRRKEKTQQILARIEREEDERVQAYRAKVESEQCKIESEGGSASPPSPPRSRQSRGSTSTSLTNQSAQTGSSQDDNLLQRRLPQTLPTADTDNPSNPAPRDVTQRSPGRSRRKGKGIYADVDEFISGLGLYGQRERTRKTPGNSPGELDGTPILELSAQISIKKQRTRPHQRRQSSPGPMSAGGRPQNYTPYRKPAKDGGMSVQEQQARRVGEKREGHEREMARERVDAVVKGMEMKKMFDPRFVGR
ncbi:MAG: hypothetical protein M1813_002157 [Trichoglossum hirsutum]|nr:MAG: hypothetical protein M1813_002157 [Trichoglossum hirsutum]